jgi:hypothetical protein
MGNGVFNLWASHCSSANWYSRSLWIFYRCIRSVTVSALSIELSNKNFFTFGSVSVHGVRTTDVLRKSGCDVPVIVEIGGATLLALSL